MLAYTQEKNIHVRLKPAEAPGRKRARYSRRGVRSPYEA